MKESAYLLIVDDEEKLLELLAFRISMWGYHTDTAADGLEGLEKIQGGKYDLILTDITMPRLDGLEMLKQARLFDPDLPVVMISAQGDIQTVRRALRDGAYDYIIKPFDFEEVEATIKRALDHGRLIRENKDYQRNLEQKVAEQAEQIRLLSINAITALANALEAKDPYTNGHSRRVTEQAVRIAKKLGLSSEEVEDLTIGGQLHDIGKIGVRESVLHKPGRLTDEEYEHIKMHVSIGEMILKPIISNKRIMSVVKYHHERFDGKGYPDRLEGDTIPFYARILAVADAFDAMNSERPYRQQLADEIIFEEIRKGIGVQFDPDIALAFLSL